MILHGVEMWPAASWHTLQMARQDEDFMLWVRRERSLYGVHPYTIM